MYFSKWAPPSKHPSCLEPAINGLTDTTSLTAVFDPSPFTQCCIEQVNQERSQPVIMDN